MKEIVAKTCFIGILLFLSGCGTIFRDQEQGVYRGTKLDGKTIVLSGYLRDSVIQEADMNIVGAMFVRGVITLAVVIDLPISIVTDTLCLPYDLTRKDSSNLAAEREHIRNGRMPNGKSDESQELQRAYQEWNEINRRRQEKLNQQSNQMQENIVTNAPNSQH